MYIKASSATIATAVPVATTLCIKYIQVYIKGVFRDHCDGYIREKREILFSRPRQRLFFNSSKINIFKN